MDIDDDISEDGQVQQLQQAESPDGAEYDPASPEYIDMERDEHESSPYDPLMSVTPEHDAASRIALW